MMRVVVSPPKHENVAAILISLFILL